MSRNRECCCGESPEVPVDNMGECDGCCYGTGSQVTAKMAMYLCHYDDSVCSNLVDRSWHWQVSANAGSAMTMVQVDPRGSSNNVWVTQGKVRVDIIQNTSKGSPANCPPLVDGPDDVSEYRYFFVAYFCASETWKWGSSRTDNSAPDTDVGADCTGAAPFMCSQWNPLTLGFHPTCDNFGGDCCEYLGSVDGCCAATRTYNFEDVEIDITLNEGCLCSDLSTCEYTSNDGQSLCQSGTNLCRSGGGGSPDEDDDCPP